MATFGELQLAVSKRLIDPSNTAVGLPDVAASLNDAIRYWKFRNLGFNVVSNPGSLTLTQYNGTVPSFSDYLVPASETDGFFIYYSQMRYPLTKVSKSIADGIYMDNGYGMPQVYSFENGSFQVYPLPDRAYQIGGNYLRDYADLVNTTDSNDFTVYAPRLIELWCLSELIMELRQDPNMATYYAQKAQDEYRNLRVLADKQQGSGRLTLSSLLV